MNRYLLATVVFAMSTVPAFAHHPLAGAPMETLTDGILSGVGHPLLGFDHLFFVIAVGIAALYTGRAKLATAAYIGAMLTGCLLMSFGVGLPVKESVIGMSLLVVGGILLSGRITGLTPTVGLFAVFGLFHGSAFGDTIAAQEAGASAAVLVGYLIGLGPAAIRLGAPGRICCLHSAEGDRGATYSCPPSGRCCCWCRHVLHA